MAISLCVLRAFAVRLRNPSSYQGTPKEDFSPRRKDAKSLNVIEILIEIS
jgi:hypothetical protein